ncbi:hypothetical protein LCGC14_0491250 [marine sediment metagenome]|uniref:Uncharacterized protein n=1 Tax=marine sediment metagenome TaxID=412755 RepID=A0A0F9SPZ0_9ZZZZ
MRKLKALEHHISTNRLDEMGACDHYIDRFAKQFPKSVKITRKNLQAVARWIPAWWFETQYLRLNDKTYHDLSSRAFYLCIDRGIEARTPVTRAHTIEHKRIRMEVLADYLGLP